MRAEAEAGSWAFLDPVPFKEIYKNGSKEPGVRPFLEGAESREPVKKGTGSPTQITT